MLGTHVGYVSGLAMSKLAGSSFFSQFWYRATVTKFLFRPEHIALTVGGNANGKQKTLKCCKKDLSLAKN
jgi:hypothetical protein